MAMRNVPSWLLELAREGRHGQTDAETVMWRLLRNRSMGGHKFRRQHPVPPYILDFYCAEKRLAVELDGGQHAETERSLEDKKRTQYLEAAGITVIRFWNNHVLLETESVLQTLWDVLSPSP
jgi:very-short-patch-repair endonuclease